jgi:hypothetical protein
MAELPRYQQTGLLPGDIPRLDMANIKESVNLTRTISSNLDRLSDFAFKDAAEKAQREGALFGAENRPSVEQVMLAVQEGKSPAELFAKPGTFFGDAARKVQAGQLRLELEVKGRQELANLSAAIDAGSINVKDVAAQIKAMTDGFGRGLAGIDAEESLRFRASMGTAANPVYIKATQKSGQILSEGIKVLAKDALNTTSQLLTDTMSAEMDPKMLLERVRIERTRVFEVSKSTNDPQFVADSMKEFDSKLVGSMVDYLSNETKSSSEIFKRLQTGDVGKLSEVYKTLDKNQVISTYMKKITEKNQVLTATKSVEKLENEGTVNSLLIEYYRPTTNQTRKRDIGLQMARMNVLSVEQMEKFLNPDVKDGDPFVAADLKYKVVTGVITDLDELRRQTESVGLSGKQYAPLAEALISRTKSDESKAYKIIAQKSGFGDVRQGKTEANKNQYAKEEVILRYYNEAKEAAILDRGSFNPEETARIAGERYDNIDGKNVQKKDARARLDNLQQDISKRKKLKTPLIIDDQTNLDDLLKQKIITNDEYVAIGKYQKTLRQENQ